MLHLISFLDYYYITMKKKIEELKFSEKIYFLTKLAEHYNALGDERSIKKALTIDLFLKAVQIVYEWEQRELTNKELVDILFATYSPDYIEQIIDKNNPEQELGIKTWIGCLYWILENDSAVFDVECAELAGK